MTILPQKNQHKLQAHPPKNPSPSLSALAAHPPTLPKKIRPISVQPVQPVFPFNPPYKKISLPLAGIHHPPPKKISLNHAQSATRLRVPRSPKKIRPISVQSVQPVFLLKTYP